MTRNVVAAATFLIALFGANAFAQAPAEKISEAKPGSVRLLVTAAIRVPLDQVRAQAQTAIGKPLVIEYGSARGNLKQTALAGQDFEVALLLPDVDSELLKAGKVQPQAYEIATVKIALALRGDVPPPDVSSVAAIKETLLKAASVKYAPTGAALLTVRKIFSTLQIADKIKDNSAARDAAVLGPGEYEINIYPLSEILVNNRLKNLGPVIDDLQVPSIITATIGKNGDAAAAMKLIQFLQGPAIDAPLAGNGMSKGRKGPTKISTTE